MVCGSVKDPRKSDLGGLSGEESELAVAGRRCTRMFGDGLSDRGSEGGPFKNGEEGA